MDTNSVELSVVLPCYNEEDAIGTCLQKIKQVFEQNQIKGEIIVADNNSTDRSAQIARTFGARVVSEPRKGYGAAYLRGLREARGTYIVIGDSDDTYNFYDIPRFLEPLRQGYEFVMGSRFKGAIKKGAMSWSHRYVGNPILSCMCRVFFRTALSDIHCGMRAFTRDAYERMRLSTLGMEFATEMVVSALTNRLKIYEIPVDYHPRTGVSKLSPLNDAWRHIRFMLLGCPVWLYLIPGTAGFLIGMTLLILLLPGPFLFLGHYWDIHFVVVGSMITILSYQLLNMGISAHLYAVKQGVLSEDRITKLLKRRFNLEKGLVVGALFSLVGFTINLLILWEWFSKGFGSLHRIRESIFAMTLLIIGIQTVFSSFFTSLFFVERK